MRFANGEEANEYSEENFSAYKGLVTSPLAQNKH